MVSSARRSLLPFPGAVDSSLYEEMPNAMALKVIEESKKAKEQQAAEK